MELELQFEMRAMRAAALALALLTAFCLLSNLLPICLYYLVFAWSLELGGTGTGTGTHVTHCCSLLTTHYCAATATQLVPIQNPEPEPIAH
jgi:hypothetical protein